MNFSLKVIRALEKRYFIGKEILILTAGYFDDSIKYKSALPDNKRGLRFQSIFKPDANEERTSIILSENQLQTADHCRHCC